MKTNLILGVAAIMLLSSSLAMAQTPEAFVPCKRFERMQQCVAVPLARSDADALAKRFLPPANGTARIYLVRPYTLEPRSKTTLTVDGKPAGELAPMTYTVLDLSPGVHEILGATRGQASAHIQVMPGEVHYLQYRLTQLFNSITEEIVPLDAKDGQQAVRKSVRIGSVF